MSKKKTGLGKGLSALFGDQKNSEKTPKIEGNLQRAQISELARNKFQPRTIFDDDKLEELASSIKKNGIIQPIAVRKNENSDEPYEIVAGERRWLASQNAGLNEIPAVVIEADDLKSLEFAIVENVQRHDLNPIEEAQGYQKLMEEYGYDQDKVAKFIGKSRAHVSNCIRLLSLSNAIIEMIETNKLSHGHAKVLVGLENSELLAKKIVEKKLSVRQAEALVRLLKKPHKSRKTIKSSNIKDLEEVLKSKLGIRVMIKNKRNNAGLITFEYKDLDQLNRLINVLKSNY